MQFVSKKQAQSASTIRRAVSSVEPLESRVLLAVFTVTSAADSGAGSLRDALGKSNNAAGVDTIAFNIASGSRVIRLTSPLPDLWDPGIMDATTQPGYAGKPLVQIDGSAAGAGATGMKMWGGSTIKGMSITGFGGGAIDMFNRGFGGNTIQASWIGVDLSGAAAGNNASGVGIWNTANNIIGGPNVADRNVISASKGALGVLVQGSAATNNLIQNNYIGTDPTGTAARPNLTNGIGVQDAPNTKILNNLISGNGNDGIIILNPNATGNTVQGNIVGLNSAGTAALPNQWYGIEIQSANNTIGGTTPAQRNIFSGNGQTGVVLYQGAATGNQIQGNYIGTDITGNVDLGNIFQGIAISGANSNSIKGNLISGNNAEGIGIFPGSNNTIQGNAIGLSASGAAMTNSTWAITLINGSAGNVVGGTAAGQANVIFSGHPSGTIFNGGGNTVSTNQIVSSQTTSNPGSFAFGASSYSAGENTGNVTITVTRTANSNVAASVNYATSNGTATSGSDYTAASGTLNFAAGETSKTFTISLTNDSAIESDETVNLALTSPTGGATLGTPSSATLTIISDDLPDRTPPAVTSAAFVYDTNPQKLRYTFSEDVSASLSSADIYIINSTTYQSYSPAGISYDRASNTAFAFSSALPKGAYRAYLFADGITDAAGNLLDGDNNGSAGGSHLYEFWSLPGDINRDGAVDFADLTTVAQNYGASARTFAQGDLDGDGRVGFSDMVLVSQNYGAAMSASPAAAPISTITALEASAPVTSSSAPKPSPNLHGRIAVSHRPRTLFSAKRI